MVSTKKFVQSLRQGSNWIKRRPRNLLDPQPQYGVFNYFTVQEFRVTTPIQPGDGNGSVGQGQGILQKFSGTEFGDSADQPNPVTLYNKTDKLIQSGSVTCGFMYGSWFVLVPSSCSQLSGGA